MPLPAPLTALAQRLRRHPWLVTGGSLFTLYTLGGFVGVPWLIRREAPKRAEALLGRPFRIGKTTFNPFTFRLVVRDVALLTPDRRPEVGFDRLVVNLEATTLMGREIELSELFLEGLRVHAVLLPGGRSNFTDILVRLEAQAATAPAAPKTGPSRGLYIRDLRFSGALAHFEDRSGDLPFESRLGPYSLELHHLRTLGGDSGRSTFTARTAHAEELRWEGILDLGALRSSGSLSLKGLALPAYAPYLRSRMPLDVQQGRLDLSLDYAFQQQGGTKVTLSKGQATLRNLALGEAGRPGTLVGIPELQVEGLEADVLESAFRIQRVTLKGGQTLLQRESDGSLNLPRLFVPRKPTPPDPKAPKPTLDLKLLALEGHALRFTDRTLEAAPVQELRLTRLQLDDLSLDPARTSRLSADLQVNAGGTLAVKGQVRPLKAWADLQVKGQGLALAPFAAYAGDTLKGTLAQGALELDLGVKADGADPAHPKVDLKGRTALKDLKILDPDGEPLVSLKRFEVSGLDARLAPLQVKAAKALVEAPDLRVILYPDRTSSLTRTFPPAPASAASTAAPIPAPSVALGQLQVRGARLSFQDRTVNPRASLGVTEVFLESSGLSTSPGAVVALDLKAKVDGVTPLSAKGRFNLFQPAADADLDLRTRGVDLLSTAPYVGHFLGYQLTRGQMDLDLGWHVRNRRLAMDNKLRLAPFTLGEKTDSPDALKIPVKLGLAILRNRQGVIPVDLPIEGNLDAPDFKLRKVILYALGNVLVKAATSPFDALGSLFGGGGDLSKAPFAPGQVLPTPEGEIRLKALQTALAEKPELSLEITGRTAPEDLEALRLRALDQRLRRALGLSQDEPLTAERRPDGLRRAWMALHPTAPGAKPQPLPLPADMEKTLREATTVDPQDLRDLAARRAQVIRERLLAAGLSADRLIHAAPDPTSAPFAGTVFSLR